MKKQLWIAAAALAAASICLPGRAHAGALPGADIVDGFGIDVHFNWSAPDAPEWQRFTEGGFRLVRTDFLWQQIEKSAGVYDFSKFDHLLSLYDASHIRTIGILAYGNSLYDGGQPPRTDADRKAFAAYAAALALHFKGRGVIWEIWNEPNSHTFWKPTPNADDYALLAIAAAKAIRAADPDAIILAPASSHFSWQFYRAAFQHGLLHYVDAVSVHPYRDSAPETALSDYAMLRRLIGAYTVAGDPVRPIVCSEWGYSTYNGGVSPDRQAAYMARIWLTNVEAGVRGSIFYDWRNDGHSNPADPEQNFGTVATDLTPKPAYAMAQTLIRALDGYRFVHRLPAASLTDHSLLFRKGDALTVVSWSSDPSASAAAQAPQLRQVARTDPDYRELIRSASVDYGAGFLVATPDQPAELAISLSDPDAAPENATITVGGDVERIRLLPGRAAEETVGLPVSVVAAGDEASLPVKVAIDGAPVIDLPPVNVDAAYPLSMSAASATNGIGVQVSSLCGRAFDGAIRFTSTGGARESVPLALRANGTAVAVGATDPAQDTVIEAVENGKVLARLGPIHFTPVAGFPAAPGEKAQFYVTRSAKGSRPSWTSAAAEQTATSGCPAPSAVALTFADAPDWTTVNAYLGHKADFPDGAASVTFWACVTPAQQIETCAVVGDSTGQMFQPRLNFKAAPGWQIATIPPVNGDMWHWGGAKDGVPHPPLSLSQLLIIDNKIPAVSQGMVEVASPAYAFGKPSEPDAPRE